MTFLRVAVERLLLLLLAVARAAFLVQGLAMATALAGALALAPADAPAWVRRVMISAALLSATFFIAGVLLVVARRWRVPPGNNAAKAEPAWAWPALLGLSLFAIAALAAIGASGLPALWSTIGVWLDRAGFWDEFRRGGSNSGLVMLPMMLALVVPSLVTATAMFSMLYPLALLVPLAARSRLFPTLLAMGVFCQAALVVTGWLSNNVLGELGEQALASMVASGDAEVLSVADDLRGAMSVLARTAIALVPPLLGLIGWLAFLRPTGPAAAYFSEE